jgi:hypothetical protein
LLWNPENGQNGKTEAKVIDRPQEDIFGTESKYPKTVCTWSIEVGVYGVFGYLDSVPKMSS